MKQKRSKMNKLSKNEQDQKLKRTDRTMFAPSMPPADAGARKRSSQTIEKAGATGFMSTLWTVISSRHHLRTRPAQEPRGCVEIPFDVHLMIDDPKTEYPPLYRRGGRLYHVPWKRPGDIGECSRSDRGRRSRSGLVISPDTDPSVWRPGSTGYRIIQMSVYPGFDTERPQKLG